MSVLADGSPTAPICIIGMAPGRDELLQDRPFVGGSGKLLWALARKAGWGRESCYILNCIGELPLGADGNPTQEQYEAYWDTFSSNLALFQGRLAVPLGGAALWRLTGLSGGIEGWRGYLVAPSECRDLTRTRTIETVYKRASKATGAKAGDPRSIREKVRAPQPLPATLEVILPTLHPAGVLRSGFATIPALAADLQRVGRALDRRLGRCRSEYVSYPVIAQGPVAFDIETGQGDAITCISLAHDIATMHLPWGSGAATTARAMLAEPNRVKIAHNVAFDAPRLARAGVVVAEPWWDTMLAAAMLQPDLYKGLNAVASMYLDCARWKHLDTIDPAGYNATDGSRTLELYHALRAELTKTNQLALFENVIMPTVPVFVRMQQRGLRLDEDRMVGWAIELQRRESAAVAEFSEFTSLSPAQSVRIAKWLYDELQLPPQHNKYGGRTVDDAAVKALLALPASETVRGALRALLQYREASKLRATYASHTSTDGCVHPSYLPASKDDDMIDPATGERVRRKGLAGTWRPTAHDPNIQNVPLEGRRLYVPHDPRAILVEADYSQIELRIAAALSGDRALLEALKGDVHEHTRQLLGCDRTRAKNVMYGTLYGAGPRKLAQLLKSYGVETSERECKALQDQLARAYPALWAWRSSVVRDVGANYHLTNPFGLRRYFWKGKDDAPAAIDYLPQSTAAMILWHVLLPLETALARLGSTILTVVHDSVLVETLPENLCVTCDILKGELEREFPQVAPGFRVPITLKRGPSWGEMKELPHDEATAPA